MAATRFDAVVHDIDREVDELFESPKSQILILWILALKRQQPL